MPPIGRSPGRSDTSGETVVRDSALEGVIRSRLEAAIDTEVLQVLNESHMHNVPPNAETHFRVVVVSSRFEGMNRLSRHRLIHRALAKELAGPVHALAVDALTPAAWLALGEAPGVSPDCLGGGRA